MYVHTLINVWIYKRKNKTQLCATKKNKLNKTEYNNLQTVSCYVNCKWLQQYLYACMVRLANLKRELTKGLQININYPTRKNDPAVLREYSLSGLTSLFYLHSLLVRFCLLLLLLCELRSCRDKWLRGPRNIEHGAGKLPQQNPLTKTLALQTQESSKPANSDIVNHT